MRSPRLTAVRFEEPDNTPVFALEPELAGTAEEVPLPPPPRVRVLVVSFLHVYESKGVQAEASTILTSAHCQKVAFLAPVCSNGRSQYGSLVFHDDVVTW